MNSRRGRRFPLILGTIALVLAAGAGPAGAVPTASSGPPRAPGDQVWVRRYDAPGKSIEGALALAVAPGGDMVFVTGYTGRFVYDYVTAAYDASTGAKVWLSTYDGGHGEDRAQAIAASPDASMVFVTGVSQGIGGGNDWVTVAYRASTGQELWVRRYRDGYRAASVAVSPDGTRVFVTGSASGSGFFGDYATVAYDASDGARLWGSTYHGSPRGVDDAYSVAASPDGARVFVTGVSQGNAGVVHFATLSYDAATGEQMWVRRYNGPGSGDAALSVGVSSDGARVFVTGTSRAPAGDLDYATVAYDAVGGERRWVARYDGGAGGDDRATSLSVGPDGTGIYVTGSSVGRGGHTEYATVAYDAAIGEERWVSRFAGPTGDDEPHGLGVTPDGSRVIVTGVSEDPATELDYATLAYDAVTGNTVWRRRYDGPSSRKDIAWSLGVSPDGATVYVTGSSRGTGNDLEDFATVAYATG